MMSLRRYIGAFLVACVALAVGIALGNGPLQGQSTKNDVKTLTGRNAALGNQLNAMRRGQLLTQAIDARVAPGLMRNRLANKSVAIFVLPGVPEATVKAFHNAVTQAGGVPVITAQLSSKVADPGQKTYVSSVAANASKGLHDLGKVSAGQSYQVLGALLGRAYTGHGTSLTFDSEASHIDGQLQGSNLVSLGGTPPRRASLAILLSRGDHGTDAYTKASRIVETALVQGLAASCDGTVVVAPPTSSEPGGLIQALQVTTPSPAHLATVDVSHSAAAYVTTIYALLGAAAGTSGHYGVVAGAAALPPGLTPARR
ncbi:MAG: copper transporter [Nocardioidaceae bacterium]